MIPGWIYLISCECWSIEDIIQELNKNRVKTPNFKRRHDIEPLSN